MEKADVISTYSIGGSLYNWIDGAKFPVHQSLGTEMAKVIKSIPNLPLAKNGKVRIISPTSNIAVAEAEIQQSLGSDCELVCGDISVIRPVNSVKFYRGDAEYIPLASSSVSVVYDRFGASWYSADSWDFQHGRHEQFNKLFREYKRVLMENGVVLIDSDSFYKINKGLKGTVIPGFAPVISYNIFYSVFKDLVYGYRKISD